MNFQFYFQGFQLVDVFNNFEDITFNYTVFSLLEFNSKLRGTTDPEEKLNVALASDVLKIINQTVPKLENYTDAGIRKDFITNIKQVRLRQLL